MLTNEIDVLTLSTPRYVLLEDGQCIGPKLGAPPEGSTFIAIYGFSGKPAFDAFCASSELRLTPYPLVKRYLQTIVAESHAVGLVVVDAVGPDETCTHATTMESVLNAIDGRSADVPVAYRMVIDAESQSYQIQPVSIGSCVTEQQGLPHAPLTTLASGENDVRKPSSR